MVIKETKTKLALFECIIKRIRKKKKAYTLNYKTNLLY